MCGRFTLMAPIKELAVQFGLDEVPDLQPRFNIAPTQSVATVLVLTSRREFKLMRWGLVPPWAKDVSVGHKMINARSETIVEKPAFRSALKHRRCLILSDGFYEWDHKGPEKKPYRIVTKDKMPFAFAGLWETWKPSTGQVVDSCTIITTAANDLVGKFHDRMPVILDPKDYEVWLDPTVEDTDPLLPLLKPYPASKMLVYPVSTLVNSPAHEDPRCVERA